MSEVNSDYVARKLGVSRKTVTKWAGNGKLKGEKRGKHWVFTTESLKQFLKENPPITNGSKKTPPLVRELGADEARREYQRKEAARREIVSEKLDVESLLISKPEGAACGVCGHTGNGLIHLSGSWWCMLHMSRGRR